MFSTVAFPDVSADRTHAFACTLQTGDVGPAVVRVAGELDLSTAAWLEQALRARRAKCRLMLVRGPAQVDRLFTLCGASDVLEITDLDPPESLAPALRRPEPAAIDDAA